jgi:predicted DNA-binding transcriptional regulator AlpA
MKDFPDAGGTQQAFDPPTEAKVADGDSRLSPLLSRLDLVGRDEVKPEEAMFNKAMNRGPTRPRPGVKGLLGISDSTFDRLLKHGKFPPPIMLGPRLPRWTETVVRQWLAEKG